MPRRLRLNPSFSANSSFDGSARWLPSGNTIVGMIILPSLYRSTVARSSRACLKVHV